ncbi:hypothetical protein ASALC70_03488 [Alcanivorax sp. ALC70]|nr:hypothetical protein ASALC70_03488 [Alcanivorax sp. ALC70]
MGSKTALPKVPSLATIKERLPIIFPEGTPRRGYVTREMAAKTIFVMFYCGAVEGGDHWMRPSQVTDMTDQQAASLSEEDRLAWIKMSLSNQKQRPTDTWYAANSREPIRDETIRLGLIPCGAVGEREGLPTTSSKPRYFLYSDFVRLFDEDIFGYDLNIKISEWRDNHLSKEALSRLHLVRSGVSLSESDSITVLFPNGQTRSMAPGPSSVISKAVIEVFTQVFMKRPAVIWLSESGSKVVLSDDVLANQLGLKIDASRTLPDIIMVDLGEDDFAREMRIWFVEVVATDGPINEERRRSLSLLAEEAGFRKDAVAYLTAFSDRSEGAYKKCSDDLAWGSFAWFLSEPDKIIEFHGAGH